jgi:hypothetical protein
MLAEAQIKLPGARLLQADLLGPWPAELDPPFDRVVSAYVFHEFDLTTKIGLLRRIAPGTWSPAGVSSSPTLRFPPCGTGRGVAALGRRLG